jgi:PQQ-dependent catabolism-associated CXXCW motif protein
MRRKIAVLVCAALFSSAALAEDAPSEPDTYRMESYRAPTPATLKGAHVLTSAEVQELWSKGGAAFIDVLPQAPRPANLAPYVVWRDRPRLDIPGSLWLPDTGYGELAQTVDAYFLAGLRKASGGDPSHALVFYCLQNCWMSWNAAKRAIKAGYVNVFWYPEGSDGWAKAGLPLEERRPEARP